MRHLALLAPVLLAIGACADSEPVDEVDPPRDPAPETPDTSCPAADIVAAKCPILSTSYLSLASYSAHNEVVVVDASNGSTCSLLAFPTSISIDGVTSLGLMGTDVFFCATTAGEDSGLLTRVPLANGEILQATTSCLSLTAYGGKIVMLHERGTTLEMFDEIGLWQMPEYVTLPELGSRLGYGDNKLYSTTTPLETITSYEPSSRTSSSFNMPPNAIDAVGVAAHGGAVTILDGNPDTQLLISLDAVTGDEIERIPVGADIPTRLHGLTNTCSGTAIFL